MLIGGWQESGSINAMDIGTTMVAWAKLSRWCNGDWHDDGGFGGGSGFRGGPGGSGYKVDNVEEKE